MPVRSNEPQPPDEPSAAQLTPREVEVLHLVAGGMTDREIGLALGISTRTVETHVAHVMQRLGVHDRAAAVAAWERGSER
jgi:DNA-binding NarL/FixJ family response regulator